MPPKPAVITEVDGSLRALFESNDEEGEFFGFMNDSMSIFADNEDGSFYGFGNNSLSYLFQRDNSTDNFLGF